MSIKYKTLFAFLVLTVTALIVTGGVYYWNSQNALRTAIHHHLETTAKIQASRVDSLITQNRERLKLITSRTQLRISLKSFLNSGDETTRTKISRIIQDAQQSVEDFEEIHVLSLDGLVIASTRETKRGRNLSDASYFDIGRERYSVETVEKHAGTKKLMLAGPLVLNGESIGVLVVRSTIAPLNRVVDDYTGLGLTGETILARVDSGTARALTPLRFDRRTPFRALTINPFTEGQGGGSLIEKADYRNAVVLAMVDIVPDTNWGIIVKIDRSEALAPLKSQQYLLAYCLLAAISVTIIISMVFSRALTKPIVDLTEVALMIASGDLNRRIKNFSKDELGKLAKAFNDMADKLIDANAQLEARVLEKTAELLQVNERLITDNTRLTDISVQDALTGIANRRAFDEALKIEWNRCKRQEFPLGLVMVDVDCFKKYNDLAGHQKGDACLMHVASILSSHVQRAGEMVARYGGEEFVVILPNQTIDDAKAFAEKLRSAIEEAHIPHPGSEVSPYITASFGTASLVPGNDVDLKNLVKVADAALYQAKKTGRNKVSSPDEYPKEVQPAPQAQIVRV